MLPGIIFEPLFVSSGLCLVSVVLHLSKAGGTEQHDPALPGTSKGKRANRGAAEQADLGVPGTSREKRASRAAAEEDSTGVVGLSKAGSSSQASSVCFIILHSVEFSSFFITNR